VAALLQQLRFRNNVSWLLLFWCMLGLAAVVSSQARAQAVLTICKQTNPSATGTSFNFTGANSWIPPTNPPGKDFTSLYPPNPFALQDGPPCKIINIPIGNDPFNKITETVPPGWALTNIFCNQQKSPVSISGGNPNPAFQFGDDTVAIDQIEPNVTCTFVNTACFKPDSSSLPPCTRPGEIVSLDLSTVAKVTGGVDPNWTVAPGPPHPTSGTLSPSWTAVPNNWVVPSTAAVADTTYTYTRWFNLPCRPDSYLKLRLSGTFAADNSGEVFLNGNSLATCPNPANNFPTCFQTPSGGTVFGTINKSLFNQGINQLTVVVGNEANSVTGLSVDARLAAICGSACTCGCPPGSVMLRNGTCGPQTATLMVTKLVSPDPTGVGSSTSYPMGVTCTPSGGGSITIQGNSSGMVYNLPAGNSCTLHESPPNIPPGCSGVSVQYSPPQPMTLVAGLNAVTATNSIYCGPLACPSGTVRKGQKCVRPIACRPPLVADAARVACVCPAGLLRRGQSCAPPTLRSTGKT
jgi:hypothetical protein